jgi:Protein of unknown function C-terminus (DUF2399)
VCQHADFDPTGLAITGRLAQWAGSIPRKMTAADYLGSLSASNPLFAGAPPETPWDPDLHDVMSHHRKARHEEEIRARTAALDAGNGLATNASC